MAVWSLLGSYEKDQGNACPGPAYRFNQVFEVVYKEGIREIRGDSDLWDLFNTWSSKTGLSTVEEGLAETQKLFHHLRDSFERTLEKMGTMKESISIIPRVLGGVCNASDHMIECFRHSPLTYSDPVLYLENADKFVNPLLRMLFEEPSRLEVSIEDLEKKGYLIHWGEKGPDKDYIISMIEPFKASSHIFLIADDVTHITDYIGITDYLFSDKLRARQEVKLAANEFFRNWPIQRRELRAYL